MEEGLEQLTIPCFHALEEFCHNGYDLCFGILGRGLWGAAEIRRNKSAINTVSFFIFLPFRLPLAGSKTRGRLPPTRRGVHKRELR